MVPALAFSTFTFLLACYQHPSTTVEEGTEASQCVDGVDNDGDGLVDCDDDGCAGYALCGGGETGGTDTGGEDTGGDSPTAELFINEFMASNSTTIDDGSGNYPDWIELYNASEQAIELEGYTLTDDLEEPDKHVLGDLGIPAGGFLLLWADGNPDAGDDHLSFKLAKDGEEIGLYDPDGHPINRLTYGEQATDVSAARMPDGGEWDFDYTPTPGESNTTGDEEER